MSSSRRSKSEMEREKVIQNRLQELLTRMLQDEDNKYCVDCDAKGPRWVSWNLGIFVCIRCAGIHRNLGVHISKVKSVNLDSWTPHQVACMQIMGNSKARAVYEANVPEGFRRPQTDAQLDIFIRAKYEKKKYIAREWLPIKAPEFPEGWTALIEAEKQKKDIRTIVLPSHTSSSNEDNFKRERQSPKDNGSSKAVGKPKVTAASTAPAKTDSIESDFDLLSLNSQQKQPDTTSSKTVKSSSIANDLLCLGAAGDSNASEFDDFIGANKPQSSAASTASNSQNGTPKTTSNSQLFDDFTTAPAAAGGDDKPTMSKDSIMALFNQGSNMPQQRFMPNAMGPAGGPTGNFQMPPGSAGGMQIPANFGNNFGLLSGVGSNVGNTNMSGFGAPSAVPSQFQQQPIIGGAPVGGNGAGFGMMNNPFLAMSQASSDKTNVFGNNQNFLQ